MKYAAQTQEALDRLDHSLRTLRDLIKRGQNEEATVSTARLTVDPVAVGNAFVGALDT